MDTSEGINLIKKQIDLIPYLKNNCHFESTHSAKWLMNTVIILEDIFGENSKITRAFRSISYEHSGSFEYEPGYMATAQYRLDGVAFRQGLNIAQGILESAVDLLSRKGIDAVYEGKDTPKEASEILKIVSIIESRLRKSVINKPEKEKDVQDVLEILFNGAGLEFTREKERILYSSKTYQPDFVFDVIETVVEVKFCDRVGREKELIGEINDYILAFKTKYPNLVFVVYDVGIIRDPEVFKNSFERQGSVIVIVVKQ